MQILTSGSFINFDNAEKIEQLIFTAKAIADSAVQTEGFASSQENNKKLALEIWAGAEYMTREHEQTRIQNLFINNFTERLREIAPAPSPTVNDLPKIIESVEAKNSPVEADASKDEFLGFVGGAAGSDIQEIAVNNDIAEKTEAMEAVEIHQPKDEAAASVQVEKIEPETAKSFETSTAEIIEIQTTELESDGKIVLNREGETSIAGAAQINETEKSAVGKITLSEKEPYRFDDCTVTATIQLLPVENGIRRTVLSVRTHDFAPQISVVELNGAASVTPEDLLPALGKAFEKYQADLPVKVMDKMKREKSAGKKQPSKNAPAAKTDSTVVNSSAPSQAKPDAKSSQANGATSQNNQIVMPAVSQTDSVQTATTSTTRNKASKPENSAQGNLFGF